MRHAAAAALFVVNEPVVVSLSLLPSERNVMVQTEQERELGLDQSLRDDNATGSALAQPGLEVCSVVDAERAPLILTLRGRRHG